MCSTSQVARVQAPRAARMVVTAAAETGDRLRLHNLSPQEGSRPDNKRKGRGYGGHQVRSTRCSQSWAIRWGIAH